MIPQGLIFQVTVMAAPAGHTPMVVPVNWMLTYDNFPPLDIFVGDSVFVFW
jgi:hypothetical protein